MQLIAPDILAEARGLTGAMLGTACVLGIALWLFGWRWHRFWVVAGITLAAGLIGLNSERVAGTQVIAVGILLAVAAGMMALELAKVLAFIAGGIGAWLAVQWVLPQAQELWAVFLSGGLFGVLLYRLWTMLLTCLMGALVAIHAGLLVAERTLHFDAVGWAAANIAALNGVTVGVVILGILLQAISAPDTEGEKKEKHEEDDHDKDEKKKKKDEPKEKDEEDEPPASPWWKRIFTSGKAA